MFMNKDQNLINEAIGHGMQIIPLLCDGQFDKAMKDLHTNR